MIPKIVDDMTPEDLQQEIEYWNTIYPHLRLSDNFDSLVQIAELARIDPNATPEVIAYRNSPERDARMQELERLC